MRLNTNKLKVSILFLMGLSITACGASNSNTASEQETASAEKTIDNASQNEMMVTKQDINKDKKAANMMTLQGQIVYQTMEGGFFSFIADDGSKYTPMQLPTAHQRHGLIVELKAEVLHDVITTTQFGQVIKVLEVKVVDESKVSAIPNQQY